MSVGYVGAGHGGTRQTTSPYNPAPYIAPPSTAPGTTGSSIYSAVNDPSLSSGPAATSPVNPYSTPSVNTGTSPYAPTTTYMDPSTLTSPQGTPPASSAPTYGSQSGPGILEQWFGSRASGSNPAYDYYSKRGLTSLDNAFAARGSYNSGAATQADSDFLSKETADQMGQLDQLAGGASGENQQQINTMLGLLGAETAGPAGLAATYDMGAGNALNTGNAAALQLGTNAALAPYQAKQGLMNNLFGLGAIGLGSALA